MLRKNNISKEKHKNKNVDIEKVPELRFKEFINPWKYDTLESVSIVKDGTHDSPKYYSNGYPLVTSKNLLDNGKLDLENTNFISKEDFDKINKRSKVDKGDILFGMIGTIGNPIIIPSDNFAIKNVALIKEKELLKNDFLIHVLNSEIIKKQFYKFNAGGTQKFIASNLIRNLKVPIPSLEEQKRISKFLSCIDKKIELLEKTLVLYQRTKTYFVNYLTKNKDKNKDFKKYKLKDLLKEYNEKSTVNNQYEVLSSSKEGITLQKEYFNRNIASSDNTGYKILHRNQLVLSPQNLWLGNININNKFEIGIVSPSYKIYDLTDKIEINYLKFIIKTPRMLYLYKTVSEQGASVVRRNLNQKLFEEIEIYLPNIQNQKNNWRFFK